MSFYFLLLLLLVSSDEPQSCVLSRNLSVLNWFPNLTSFSLPSNLHLYVPRLVFHRIEKLIDCILSGKSLFSLVVRLAGSSDVPLSPFRFLNSKLSKMDF